jgi:hypothetical protein
MREAVIRGKVASKIAENLTTAIPLSPWISNLWGEMGKKFLRDPRENAQTKMVPIAVAIAGSQAKSQLADLDQDGV